MQLIKDLWGVVQALLQVVKTLVSYVRLSIHFVENLIGKLTAKKEVAAPVVEKVEPEVSAPVVEAAPVEGQ
jgi:hypothetical protein